MVNKRLFFHFLVTLILVAVKADDFSCPPPGQVLAACSATILYLIDTSLDLSDRQIKAEFNFTRYRILPGTDWDRNVYVSLFSYGINDEIGYVPSNYLTDACIELGGLQYEYENFLSQAGSLYNALVSINQHYGQLITNLVIFSGSKDLLDVHNAGNYALNYMPKVKFTVVALDGAVFNQNNFLATIYRVNDLSNPPENLDWCVINSACGIDPNCNINETPSGFPTTASTPSTRSTSRPTPSNPPTTRTTTTTRSPITTPQSGAPSTLQCQCDTMSAWVDMIFVIDASASTGEMGLDEMWGMAATMLELFNVQKTGYAASNYTSRVGIITYGNSANVLYPLGSVNNDDIDRLFDLPFNNDPMTNLEAGLQAAIAEFNGPNHRINAREVIIVMAAAFNPIGTNAPSKTASTFKEDGGVLMVFNYVPTNGVDSPMLASLSSPDYFFSTTLDSHYTDMALGLCDANCFCRDNLHAYEVSNTRQYPTKGCYVGVTAENNYARAVNNCKSHYYNGTLTTDEDSTKTTFLKSLFPTNKSFYIGLTYDNNDRMWEWPDGTAPGSYQPWVDGRNPDGAAQQCVYLNSNSHWQPVDCRNGYSYVCEVMPCDSLHYCT